MEENWISGWICGSRVLGFNQKIDNIRSTLNPVQRKSGLSSVGNYWGRTVADNTMDEFLKLSSKEIRFGLHRKLKRTEQ